MSIVFNCTPSKNNGLRQHSIWKQCESKRQFSEGLKQKKLYRLLPKESTVVARLMQMYVKFDQKKADTLSRQMAKEQAESENFEVLFWEISVPLCSANGHERHDVECGFVGKQWTFALGRTISTKARRETFNYASHWAGTVLVNLTLSFVKSGVHVALKA